MKKRDYAIVLLPILAYLTVVGRMVNNVLNINQGKLIYAIDDAYIHLAIARNLIENHTFCSSGESFCSVSSSALWPFLVAGLALLPIEMTWIPLILNVLGGVVLVFLFYRIARIMVGPPGSVLIAIAAIFVSLTPGMTLIGMEHVWHQAMVLGFALAMFFFLERENNTKLHQIIPVALLGLLASSIRLESLFVVLIAGFFLFAKKRFLQPILLGAISAVPLAVQAVNQIMHGEMFLSNSILIKAIASEMYDSVWMDRWYRILFNLDQGDSLKYMFLAALVLFLVYYLRRKLIDKSSYRQGMYWLLLFIGSTVLHETLSVCDFVYRHESYLLSLGNVSLFFAALSFVSATIPSGSAKQASMILAACLVIFLPTNKLAYNHIQKMTMGTANIHDQQYQMGRFVDRYYRGKGVALNDIGYVSYLARQTDILDLVGLANHEVVKVRVKDQYTKEYIDKLTREAGIDLALLYEPWWGDPGLLPENWRKIASWEISHNVVCSYHTVAFFSLRRELDTKLLYQIMEFIPELPGRVKMEIFYSPNRPGD